LITNVIYSLLDITGDHTCQQFLSILRHWHYFHWTRSYTLPFVRSLVLNHKWLNQFLKRSLQGIRLFLKTKKNGLSPHLRNRHMTWYGIETIPWPRTNFLSTP
jgi:hypothetical protein